MIRQIDVNSKYIKFVQYDAALESLKFTFTNGNVITYRNIKNSIAEELNNSEDMDEFYVKIIKLGDEIYKLLLQENKALSQQEISTKLRVSDVDVLRALNKIERSIVDMVVVPLNDQRSTSVFYKAK